MGKLVHIRRTKSSSYIIHFLKINYLKNENILQFHVLKLCLLNINFIIENSMKSNLKLLRELRYTLDIVGEPHQAGDIKF